MKTREQWVEEVMGQADCYAKSFMCEVLARSHTAAVLPANAVKNMEHEKLRALLLEVPNAVFIGSIVGIDKNGVRLPLKIETIGLSGGVLQILVHLPEYKWE